MANYGMHTHTHAAPDGCIVHCTHVYLLRAFHLANVILRTAQLTTMTTTTTTTTMTMTMRMRLQRAAVMAPRRVERRWRAARRLQGASAGTEGAGEGATKGIEG